MDLKKIGKTETDECRYYYTTDDTLFYCLQWEARRRECIKQFERTITADNFIEHV